MTSPRKCALDIFHETLQKGSYPNLLYKERAAAYEERDRKLITLLISDSLSNLIHIDYILSKFIGGKKVKPIIRNILRMAVDQIKFLEFPHHAVINESVELCGLIGKPMLKGFVNGVLRNYVRNMEISYPKEKNLEYFSIINSKPMWLMELWNKDYGFENAVKYSKIRKSGTAIRFKQGENSEKWLKDKGYQFKKSELINGAYILESSYDIHNTSEYKKGFLSIQGIGSMAACEALDPRNGETVLDACSAPGGKTVFICEKMKKGKVIACDVFNGRINLVRQNVSRFGFSFVEYVLHDMSVKKESFINRFDKVLVDAPCSGLGELNSKPDIMLNKSIDGIYELSKLQYKILDRCAEYLKSGGILVYSTCTINKIENDNVIKKFLEKHEDFKLDSFKLTGGQAVESGMLQMTPDEYEGFFVARLKKQ